MTKTIFLLVLISFARVASAQGLCNTGTSVTQVSVGQAFTYSSVADSMIAPGQPAMITSGKVYRNNVPVTATIVVDLPDPVTGLRCLHVGLTETVAGTVVFESTVSNAAGESPKSPPFSLLVVSALAVPKAPVTPRVTAP